MSNPGRRGKYRRQGNGSHKPIDRSEVLAMIKANNKLMIEPKVTHLTQNGGVDAFGSIFNLTSNLTRGDGAVDQFTGNLLRPSMLRIIGTWSTGQTHNTCRVIVFQWLDASLPTAAGIINVTGSPLAPFSPLLWANVHKIHVLYDEVTTLFPVAGSFSAASFNCRLMNCFKTIEMPTGASPVPQMAGLYILAVDDDLVPAFPQLVFQAELRFTDA